MKENKNLLSPINYQSHPFHLVDPSPWPLVAAFGAFCTVTGGVLVMHGYHGGSTLLYVGFSTIIYVMFCWWRDIIREATFEGQHTHAVQQGLRWGMALFIVSEIMFFFAFFWAFFHSSFNPSIAVGSVWPPAYLTILSAWKVPFLNTIILLTSGCTITVAHHAIVNGSKLASMTGLIATIILAIIFTKLQEIEYVTAPFGISDSVYGSTFFLATGFHGLHVQVGTVMLFVCLLRLIKGHFTRQHHFGFEAAAWY